jgi:hypothetical protein
MPFKQQWLALIFRQSISETIAEIESGPMPAFPEISVRLARDSSLLERKWLDTDQSFLQEGLKSAA